MTEIEKAAMLLRRALSEKELVGEIKESDAVRLIESIYEAERLLTKYRIGIERRFTKRENRRYILSICRS